MSVAKKERAAILVKAFPQPSQKYDETVCCAGVTPEGQFVRLYPIRYRQLRKEQQFERWDVVEYLAKHPHDDQRPESRHVDEDSLRIVQSAGALTDAQRVRLWASHVSETLVALKADNVSTERSLGIVRPDIGSIRFLSRLLDASSSDDQALREAFRQVSMLEAKQLDPMLVEYEFRYRFTCGGIPHSMKIHDWEVQAAFFAYQRRYGAEALPMLVEEYGQRIPSRNLHLMMGTMKAHPRQFIVIGLLRSPLAPVDIARQALLI